MKNIARPAWMAILACTLGLSLSGCADLVTQIPAQLGKGGSRMMNPGDLAGGTSNNTTSLGNALTKAGTVGHALIQDAVASLQADADMDVGGMLADDPSLAATYQVMAMGMGMGAGHGQAGLLRRATLPGALIRQAIRKHQDEMRQKAKVHLDARRPSAKISERTVTENEDGTRTIKARLEITNKLGTHKQSLEKLVDADGTVLDYVHDLERTGKDGRSVVSHRERHTEDDGSFKATFSMVITRKDGAKKTIEWTRTGAADGSEVGEGKIVRFDGSVVTTTITKSADGTIVTKTTDTAAQVQAEVTKDEVGATAEATVTDTQTGQVVEKVEAIDTEAVEASDS